MNDNKIKQPGAAEGKEIVCACTNLSLDGLKARLAAHPMSFDELLSTKAENGVVIGGKCTACRLDLEYFFSTQQGGGKAERKLAGDTVNRDESPHLRHRVYRFIDRFMPPVPFVLYNTAAVIAGPGIDQALIVANDSLMYEDEVGAPTMTLSVRVRDTDGRERHRETRVLPLGEQVRIPLSRHLPAVANDGLAIGSLEIVRRARAPGYRGTTRPQIVIDAAAGTCAVHTQGSNGPGEKWFALYHKRAEERFFVAMVNSTKRPMDFTVSYPYAVDTATNMVPEDHRLTIPPWGARLHEVRLGEDASAALTGELYRLRCASSGPGGRKINFICASPTLDRFSIDHPAP